MKQCPNCSRTYDDTLSFCLDDGSPLSFARPVPDKTLIAPGPPSFNPPPQTPSYPPPEPGLYPAPYAPTQRSPVVFFVIGGFAVIVIAAVMAGVVIFAYTRKTEDKPVTVSLADNKASPASTIEPTKPLSFSDGTRYEGGQRDGHPEGRGIMIFPNGDTYDGEFRDGKRNGTGVFTFHDGSKYSGEFRNDLYNGHGVMSFPNGNKYDGNFSDGRYDGEAVYTFTDGSKYVGHFKNDLYNGHGVMTFADGNVYDGEFRNGKYNGQGTFTFSDGRKQEGVWVDGKLVSSSRQAAP